ncbi:hypothetical protein MF672_017545 [Actinomadura sp. ATCC 31491]|uniref:Uncharacterized protein n=1 Tax=Actinomadura luzonensis TaxID=2805427 RepID=A0ABT0FTA9_9ACTN|nr:hypothetical protein [Actinomadura luzonensis]MCK2215577.1 hypothetical protein [Actinomadura luzonensis]
MTIAREGWMAELIRWVEDEVPVSYGRFGLGAGSLEPEEEGQSGVMLAEPGGLALDGVELESGANTARVRMEAWDSEPLDAPGEPWTQAGQIVYLSSYGIAQVSGIGYSPSGQKLLIGPPFCAYGLRAYTGQVRMEPAPWDDSELEAVEESFLLRFWPLADAAAPALRSESEARGLAAARMRELVPLPPGAQAPRPEQWPALRPHPRPDPATLVMRYAPGTDHLEPVPPAGSQAPDEAWRRVEEVLGDLRYDLLGNLPNHVESWSRSRLEHYAARLRVDRRVGRELNPDDAPTMVLKASDVRTVLIGPDPGHSGRAWVWGKDDDAYAEVLSVDRQIVARDPIRGNSLLTGIVTILRNEDDHVEVRAATAAEAARVSTVERLRG